MKPTTIASLQKCKQDKKRFATITAYDYSFAKLFADTKSRGAAMKRAIDCSAMH